jgi:hypothetical protein
MKAEFPGSASPFVLAQTAYAWEDAYTKVRHDTRGNKTEQSTLTVGNDDGISVGVISSH